MDKSKSKIIRVLTLLFFVLFPFGQLLRYEVAILGVGIALHPIDLVVGLTFLTILTSKFKKPSVFKSLSAFILAGVFSLIFSLSIFGPEAILKGTLYFIRLTAYLFFFIAIFNTAKSDKSRTWLFNSLILLSTIVAIFGWLQYIWFPDLRSLFYLGWDDHLYRLIGTFLDPGLTSIILVFGFILSLVGYLQKKRPLFLLSSIFLFVTTAFTYARASYLALLAGVFIISKIRKTFVPFLVITLGLIVVIFSLPRPEGYGVMLERTHSIYAKFANYGETLEIIKKSPLFGVGFNNTCLVRVKYLGERNALSHACGGSDSSLLALLATTGIVGTLTFLKFGLEVVKGPYGNIYRLGFIGCLSALLIHSIFVNSLFYPWVMGYMAILAAIKE